MRCVGPRDPLEFRSDLGLVQSGRGVFSLSLTSASVLTASKAVAWFYASACTASRLHDHMPRVKVHFVWPGGTTLLHRIDKFHLVLSCGTTDFCNRGTFRVIKIRRTQFGRCCAS